MAAKKLNSEIKLYSFRVVQSIRRYTSPSPDPDRWRGTTTEEGPVVGMFVKISEVEAEADPAKYSDFCANCLRAAVQSFFEIHLEGERKK